MSGQVVVLTGGVGGAKLVFGLGQVVAPENLKAIINTGDDFTHLGLHVSPDIDTLLYTLAGKANTEHGWGRANETWSFMAALKELGGEDWFALGDKDLATHVLRTERLARGDSLTEITRAFAAAWGVGPTLSPMSNDAVATVVRTDEEDLPFQHYFVARQCEPRVREIIFQGSDAAAPAPGVLDSIGAAETILIAPSNPYLSIDPILSVPGVHAALVAASAPIIAVSPLIKGKAVKGPTTKMMAELGLPVDNYAIACHYKGLIDGLVINSGDAVPEGIATAHTDTLMRSDTDKVRVAEVALALARDVAR